MHNNFHLIISCGYNGEIGANNDLLWHLPKDMAVFVKATRGGNVIMGRNTYMSLPESIPALPGRTNVVITSRPDVVIREYQRRCDFYEKDIPRLICAESLDEAATLCNDPVANSGRAELDNFIIGGASLYDYALDKGYVDVVIRTVVHESFPNADTYIKNVDLKELGFKPLSIEHYAPDERNKFGMSIEKWKMNKGEWYEGE